MPVSRMVDTTGPRVMLAQLRRVMAQRLSTQDRLDQIVDLIARNMAAEVCSAYLINSKTELELFATKGLNPDAVHKTRLQVGEGLVGTVAANEQVLNLSDAPTHPNFAYRPETGEDLYTSFLGVPIQRGGRVLGVLVVQNQTHRHYAEDDEEALHTVAMVLAEMIVSREIIGRDDNAGISNGNGGFDPGVPVHCEGVAFADGLAIGTVVLHQLRIKAAQWIAEDIDAEIVRLDTGIEELKDSIDRILQSMDVDLVGESKDVLETYRMFAHDEGWLDRMRDAIASGLTAEAAVEKVQMDMRQRLGRVPDPYLRERLNDLDDLANRLLRHLIGDVEMTSLPDNAIVIARDMGPAELLDYDRSKLAGVVLEEGSATSHATIVANALEIPLVGRVKGVVDQVEPGDRFVVDGESGIVHIRPSADVEKAYSNRISLRAEQQAQFSALKDEPAITLDGKNITLNINAGLLIDLPHLEETGASGIGLFRTELQFMVRSTLPRLKEQTDFYRRVLDSVEDHPVVFRTVDLGSDKVLPYLDSEPEENPALGWRSLRLALDRPGLLRYQIRALLAAASGRELRIMFPLVAEVAEYEEARALVNVEVERMERRGGKKPSNILVGTMLEVPSLAWQLDALLPRVDFVSVGSNDLVQFFFACDRSNPRLTDRYDALSPAILALLRHVAERAEHHNVPLSLCGEMAGKPIEAMALLGLGYRAISMSPASVGPVKRMVRHLPLEPLKECMKSLTGSGDHSVRRALEQFAMEHNVPI